MGIIVSNAGDCGERRKVLSGINGLLFTSLGSIGIGK